ncbi:MAG: GAF domain-containing protein, partial [Myxococcales bacterium]
MAKFEPARSLEQRVVELDAACERERRISRALRDVGVALGSTLDLDHLLELILLNITQALEADRATLYLLDEANDELVSRVVQGDEVRSIHLKNGQGIAGHVARTGKPLHVREAYRDPRFSHQWDLISGYRTHSVLAVPMKNHLGKTIGVVQVLNKLRGDFSEADADILHALATQAAVSIDNSRLFLSVTQKNMQLLEIKEQLEARVHDLKLLFDLESAMARAATLEDLFAAVLGEAMSTCDARTGAVAMREQDETPGSLHVLDGTTRTLKQYPFKNQGLIGYAIRSGKTVVSTDVFNDKRRNPPLEMRICKESNTAIAVPLEGEQGEPLGALALYDKRGALFTDADLDLVQLLAANASTAIRLQLAREARERGDRLSTIGSLLSAVIHDLKTPLSVISGYVQLMVAAEARQKRSDYSELVLRQFDHIASMQREVLEFARGEKSILVRRVYLQKFFGELREAL